MSVGNLKRVSRAKVRKEIGLMVETVLLAGGLITGPAL